MTTEWKTSEKLVQLIEKSLSPESRVLHNQFLPVIGSVSNRKRQCDVVIETGRKSRKTVTLVEVQHRSSAIDINTFNGWLEKLKEVGAQHLICVSMLNFPQSIKEKAQILGSTVRLIKLSPANAEIEIPLQLLNSEAVYSDFDISVIDDVNIECSKSELTENGLEGSEIKALSLKANDKVFICGGNESVSFYNLAQSYLQKLNFEADECIKVVAGEGELLSIRVIEKIVKLNRVEFNVRWTRKLHTLSPVILAYEQLSDGPLAWVLEYFFNDGDRSFWFKLPFTGDGNKLTSGGTLAFSTFGVDFQFKVSSKDEKYR